VVALLRRLHGVTKARILALLLHGGIDLLHMREPLRGTTALGLTRRLAGTARLTATGSSASGHISTYATENLRTGL
jgi:hypothetical protein